MNNTQAHPLTRPATIACLAAVACMLWGSAAPVIKIGYRLFEISENDVWTMILFAGLRFLIAGALVLAFAWITARKLPLPKPESWINIGKLSFMQTVAQYMLFYVGVANASGVHASLLSGVGSLWAILVACFLFRQEKMNLAKALGCLMSFAGILIMNLSGVGGSVRFLGEGFLLLSGLSNGIASCLIKDYSQKENAVLLTGWQFFIGGAAMIAAAMPAGGRLSAAPLDAIGILVYLGFLSAVAYTLWTMLIRFNSVSAVSVYGFFTPLFGVVISALLLGEVRQAFDIKILVSLLLICCGIIAVNRFGAGQKR